MWGKGHLALPRVPPPLVESCSLDRTLGAHWQVLVSGDRSIYSSLVQDKPLITTLYSLRKIPVMLRLQASIGRGHYGLAMSYRVYMEIAFIFFWKQTKNSIPAYALNSGQFDLV